MRISFFLSLILTFIQFQSTNNLIINTIAAADANFEQGNLDSAKRNALLAFDQVSQSTPDSLKKRIYFRLYEIYAELSCLDTALKFARMDSAATYALFGQSHFEYARCLNNIAGLFILKSLPGKADFYLKIAEPILIQTIGKDSRFYADWLENQGLSYMSKGQLIKSESLLIQSLELRKKYIGENHVDYAASLHNLATVYHFRQLYEKSETLFRQSLEIKKKLLGDGHPRYSNSLNNLGILLFYTNRSQMAAEIFEKAVKSFAKQIGKENVSYAKVIANIGTIFYQKGEYAYSEWYLREAADIYSRINLKESNDYFTILNNLAQLYILKGNYTKAEPLLTRLIEEKSKIFGNESNEFLKLYNDLAGLYLSQGRLGEAKDYYNRLIHQWKAASASDSTELASYLAGLANVYSYLGDLESAVGTFDKVLMILHKLGMSESPMMIKICNNLAGLYYNLGRYDEAIELTNRLIGVIKIDNEFYPPELLASMSNLGMAYIKIGEKKKADSVINELESLISISADTSSFLYAAHLNNLGIYYQESKQYDKSIDYFKESIMLAQAHSGENSFSLITLYNNLASVYFRLGDYNNAAELTDKSLKLVETKIGRDNHIFNTVLFNSGLLKLMNGDLPSGTDIIKKSISQSIININRLFPLMSENEQLKYVSSERNRIDILFSLVKEQYINYEAIEADLYDFWINLKGLAYFSSRKINELVKNSDDSTLAFKYNALTQLRAKLIELTHNSETNQSEKLDSIRFEINLAEKELAAKVAENNLNEHSFRFNDIVAKLNDNEAVIEIIRADYNYKEYLPDSAFYIVLLGKKNSINPEMFILKNGKELESDYYLEYKKLFSGKKAIQVKEEQIALERLYNQYWEETDKKLKGIEKIYISHDGIFNKINLNTLFVPKEKRYIIDKYEVVNLGSTREIVTKINYMNNSKTACLIGDALFNIDTIIESSRNKELIANRAYIQPLAGTKAEIEQIGSILSSNNWQTNRFTGSDASEKSLKSQKSPRLLHIASHGVFLRDSRLIQNERSIFKELKQIENPLYKSCIFLAGAGDYIDNKTSVGKERSDGILTAYEVLDLALEGTELVVLSCCETGLGEIRNGEGVFGLQRAFKIAGAGSLVMSLWKVNDKATQELMTMFYSYWISGKSKADALRQASIMLRKKYPGIYYWGAFIMLGE